MLLYAIYIIGGIIAALVIGVLFPKTHRICLKALIIILGGLGVVALMLTVLYLVNSSINFGTGKVQDFADSKISAARYAIARTFAKKEGMAFADESTIDFDPNIPDDIFEAATKKLLLKVDPRSSCVVAGQWMAEKHGVPVWLVMRTIYTESKGNPLAINNNSNSSQDRGCMQINSSAHPDFFKKHDWKNPVDNVDYGVQFLKKLHQECGTWACAALRFNSRNKDKQAIYGKALNRTALAIGAPTVGY